MKKISPTDIHRCMQAVYGDKCGVGYGSLSKQKWGKQVCVTKQGRIKKNHQIKQKDMAFILGISTTTTKKKRSTLTTFLNSKTFVSGGYHEN